MNEGDQAADFLYLMVVLVLVASAFMVRRVPIGRSLQMFVAWAVIFLAAFVAFTLKDDFMALGKRVMDEARGDRAQIVQAGETLRITRERVPPHHRGRDRQSRQSDAGAEPRLRPVP